MNPTQKILLIDIGNSFIKWALVDKNSNQNFNQNFNQTFNQTESLSHQSPNFLEQFISQVSDSKISDSKISQVAISYVQSRQEVKDELINALNQRAKKINQPLNYQLASSENRFEIGNLSIINGYQKVSQLGTDRWLSLIGALFLNQKKSKNFAVIDFGSVISIDFVKLNPKNENQFWHLGGLLIPDFSVVMESLSFKMPIDSKSENKIEFSSSLVGKNTKECIEIGFIQGIKALLDSHPLIKEMDFFYFTGGFFPAVEKIIGFDQKN